ncbi:MAG: zinc-dependent metalloprotease, partial [bacterium]
VGLPIETVNPETGGMLVDLYATLLSDRADFSTALSRITGGSLQPDPDDSRFTDIRNFPENTELSALNRFVGEKPSAAEGVPDARSMDLVVHTSIAQLPEKSNFRPRFADDRVGYFLRAVKDFSDDRPNPFARYIIRWNLEKKDPAASLSEPKQPVVFWVENTTPPEYRQAVKDGIEYWNAAFVAAGFKNAIVSKIMPDDADWDPADMRYSVVRWIISHQPSFSGLGPAIANPFTGEILNADPLIEGESIRNLRRGFRNYVMTRGNALGDSVPALLSHDEIMKSILGGSAPPTDRDDNAQFWACHYAYQALDDAVLGVEAMIARGDLSPYEQAPKEYINDFITRLVAHEVGHVLGLRHNFKGSTHIPPQDLNNTDVTHKYGLTSSVMDYVSANIAPKGDNQGDYFSKAAGPYDLWAIQYGYTEFPDAHTSEDEVPTLNDIAQRAREPMLAYATDEDAYWSSAIPYGPDPTANGFDLSSDVLTYNEQRIQLIEELWGKFSAFALSSENYNELRTALDGLFNAHRDRAVSTIKFIGGMYMTRYHDPTPQEGPDASPPTAAVSANTQRRALALLTEYVFSDAHYQFDTELLKRLAPDRWDHWGKPDLFAMTQLDYPLYDRITAERALVLSVILNPVVLQRVVDNELRTPAGQTPLTMPELFTWLSDSVFTEIGGAKGPVTSISALRRATQKDYVDLLGRLIISPPAGTPGDAKALAAFHLTVLNSRISSFLVGQSRALDDESRAHLIELSATIGRSLEGEAPVLIP